jgi:hypothetical protein
MGHFTQIRGWLETEFERVPQFKEIVRIFDKDYSRYVLDDRQAELYQSGWHFPDRLLNWTSYIFYGADVRSIGEDYVKDQIIAMARLFNDTNGLFYFDDDEGNYPITWKISDSKIKEENRVI